jgi:flagellin
MGNFSILNNISGLNAQNQLNINNVNLTRTLLRLSSGKRINSGADDAAGLQIADSLRANAQALNQAVRNANDGIGVCQIADGALQEISNLLTRSVTLASEAATETVDDNGRASLNAEFVTGVDMTTQTGAASALTTIEGALNAVASMRAAIGGGMNRLQSAVAVLQTQSQNTQAAESSIRDANIAEEVANLTKYQILAQSGIAALAQANANSQSVLTLLRA